METKNLKLKITTLDFLNSYLNKNFFEQLPNVCAFEFPHIDIENISKKMIRSLFQMEIENYFSSQINQDWIESKYSNFDLFAQDSCLFIFDCEKLDKKLLKLLANMARESSKRTILFFNQEMEKIWKDDFIKIKTPNFWEGEKIFESLITFYGVALKSEELKLISPYLTQDAQFAFSFSKSLSVFDPCMINKELINNLLPKMAVGQFELIEMLNHKKTKEFFSQLCKVDQFDELYNLVSFSISHLLKIVGPFERIPNPNKYQKGLISASQLWNEREISGLIGLLKDLLVEIRLKNKKAFMEIMKASI